MSQTKPLIAIILVNYNSEKDTKECLESLAKIKADTFDYKIIVVDNGSKKDLKLPKRLNDDNLDLIRTEANIGFTGGNNLGISYAVKNYHPEYFLLLNNDTLVQSAFLEKLKLCLENNEQAGIAAAKIYFAPGYEYHKKSYKKSERGQVIWFAGGTIDWANLVAFHRGVDEVDRGQFDHLGQTDFATGCCMLIKRELIDEVGILDKKYFLYLEDVDYSVRALKKGYQIIFCPKSVVWHKNAGSSEGPGSKIHQYYQTRNRLLFFVKYGDLKVKITAWRLWLRFIQQGNLNTKAAWDYLWGRFGKQPVL